MELNFTGISAALAAFLGIWLGHVSVRRVEAAAPRLWLPVAAYLMFGSALVLGSLLADNRGLSAALGILGLTALWDALELRRQEKRVKRGHAPANTHNPRHAQILTEYPAATTLDLLKRHPVGRPISAEEAVRLVEEAE